jgi:hypothetical protein
MRRRQVVLGAGVVVGSVAAGEVVWAAPVMASDDHGVTGSWMVIHQDTGDAVRVRSVASLAAGDVLVNHDISPAGSARYRHLGATGRQRVPGHIGA